MVRITARGRSTMQSGRGRAAMPSRRRGVGTRQIVRPVHPAIHRQLKVPLHIRLQHFEGTRKGPVVHYTVNGQPQKRLLSPAEVKTINRVIEKINKNNPTKRKQGKRKLSFSTILASAATSPQVATTLMHFLQ